MYLTASRKFQRTLTEGRNLYENKSTRMQCLKIKVQRQNVENNKSIVTSKWVLPNYYDGQKTKYIELTKKLNRDQIEKIG